VNAGCARDENDFEDDRRPHVRSSSNLRGGCSVVLEDSQRDYDEPEVVGSIRFGNDACSYDKIKIL
jgi:hypothetical protein